MPRKGTVTQGRNRKNLDMPMDKAISVIMNSATMKYTGMVEQDRAATLLGMRCTSPSGSVPSAVQTVLKEIAKRNLAVLATERRTANGTFYVLESHQFSETRKNRESSRVSQKTSGCNTTKAEMVAGASTAT